MCLLWQTSMPFENYSLSLLQNASKKLSIEQKEQSSKAFRLRWYGAISIAQNKDKTFNGETLGGVDCRKDNRSWVGI